MSEAIYDGSTVQYGTTMTKKSDGSLLDLSSPGTATMRYWYDGASSAEDATMDNTLTTDGVVQNTISHAQSGLFEWQFYGIDVNSDAWRSRRRVVTVEAMITAP